MIKGNFNEIKNIDHAKLVDIYFNKGGIDGIITYLSNREFIIEDSITEKVVDIIYNDEENVIERIEEIIYN